MPTEVQFDSGGAVCVASFHPASCAPASSPHDAPERGAPCVVMAHGFGGTRDSGLDGFAERIAASGIGVLAFDYRGFGASGGNARGDVRPSWQIADYRAAIAHARTLPGVDPDRVIVWGVSFAAGHAFTVAAADPRIAGVIALTPAIGSPIAMLKNVLHSGIGGLGVSLAAWHDAVRSVRGQAPVSLPVVGQPGSRAIMTAPGADEAYSKVAGATWRNRVSGRSAMFVGAYRPGKWAAAVRCPVLVQIADDDQSAPPDIAGRVAFAARAEVRHYPCDHFDVYPGARWFNSVVAHQIHFLTRYFVPGSRYAPVVAR